jgi:hypothetical protein
MERMGNWCCHNYIYFQNTDLNRSKDDAMATVPPVDQLEGETTTLQNPAEEPFIE